MKTVSLNGTWQLRGRSQEGDFGKELCMEATVPGCVQLDLSRAGYLPEDLYMGENILETEKYETWQWWYTRTFSAPETKENVYLVFEGVDCIAHYYLNGQKLGDSENMFISHEFEVGKYLQEGENNLTVHLESPVLAAHALDQTIDGFMAWHTANNGIRKPPHSYGWDIMPRAVTSGLWREVRLEIRDPISFSQMYFCTKGTKCEFLYELSCKYQDLKDLEIVVEGSCGESRFHASGKPARGKADWIPVTIDNPQLWWPYGYGEPNIYDATVRIYSKGVPVHEATTHFGIRDVKLEHTDITDGENGKFRFLINGVEIMCKGSNWVPMDAFHCRDAERYDAALTLVKDIGCNILRCWGGNVYEDHAFFDFCDRNGIMVWQDFAMACALYPQDERFEKLIRQEVQSVVRKLRQHPSIILWAGDNEVDMIAVAHGFNPAGNRVTREFIPQTIHCNDKYRPYLPSSPYVSEAVYRTGSLKNLPEDHNWGARDYFKSDFYKNNCAHFISETGYHGCPSMESLKKFLTPDRVWPYQDNPQWILHSSDQLGNDARVMLMHNQVKQLFGAVPTDPESYIFASQVSQAEANKYFIERMRVGRPNKTGIIWWNLLDGWPQMSDAVVDYYYTKKLAYGYIKRSQAPFSIIADEIADWNTKLFACNDTLQLKSGRVTVMDGQTKEVVFESDFTASANSSACIGQIPVFYSEHKMLLIQWVADGQSGFNHYLCGYPPFDLSWYQKMAEEFGL